MTARVRSLPALFNLARQHFGHQLSEQECRNQYSKFEFREQYSESSCSNRLSDELVKRGAFAALILPPWYTPVAFRFSTNPASLKSSEFCHDPPLFIQLVDPNPQSISIVFVHGFTGHPKSTWTLDMSKVQQKRPPHQRTGSGFEPPKFLRFTSFPFSRARTSQSQSSSKFGKFANRLSEATGSLPVGRSSTIDHEESGDVYWPQDLLPLTAPKARVLTYGYDTKIKIKYVQQVSQNTVDNHAWELLCSLEAVRRTPGEQDRPLVFIAHSLGGLVVKKMLKQAQDRATTHPHLNRVFLSTVSILFFGTPHRGADPRGFLHHVLSVSAQGLGVNVNKRVVATLMPHAEPVSTFGDFAALASQQNWIIYSFQEEYGVAALFNKKVVDDHSSCLALPTIETTQHISDNHMDMCRFFGLDDPGYRKVSAALERILAHTGSKLPSVGTSCEVPQNKDNPSPGPSAASIVDGENATRSAPECENSSRDSLERENSTEHTLSQETMDTLMNLLRFDQIDARLLTLRTAQGKTCEWFLSKPEYLQWQNNNETEEISSFLWIKGKPGAGKSILMKHLLSEADQASRRSGVHRRIVISFFFNARGENLERSTLGCYRSLLLQLFEKDPRLKAAMNYLGTSAARYIENHGWNLETLTQMLTKAFTLLRAEQTLQCFVDALDECEEWEVRNMVSFFEGLGERMPTSKARLNICFSSRHYPSIVPKKGLQVTLEAEAAHFQDISRFVEAELRLGDSDQTEEIKAAIMAKCSNIFLWAALVVPILNREYARGRMTAIRTRLDSIPPGLDELFDMILTRDDEDLEELQMCIKWILFATRPMKPQELFVAIKVGLLLSSGASEDANMEYPKDFATADLCRYIESSSKGLAEVTRSTEPTVQFIHESVRDFLLSKGRNSTHWSGFGLEVLGETQDLLTKCCLLQVGCMASPLENVPPSNPFRLENAKYPFLEYAVNNMLHHSNSAEREKISQLDFLQSFPLLLWIRLFNSFMTTEIRKYPPDTNIVYILTTYNLHYLLQIHPDSPRHLEIRGGRYMYPLIAAIVLRNIEAIEALLAASGMVSASGKRFSRASLNLDSLVPTINSFDFTPWNMDLLSCLVHFDQLQMVQHYLKKISDSGYTYDLSGSERRSGIIDAESFRLDRALFSVRSQSMTAFLVGLGADPGTMDSHASTPLCHAIKAGHVEVFRLLSSPESSNFPLPPGFSRDLIISKIKSRVKVHSKDHFGWTALHHAANGGFSEILEQLTSFPEVDPNDVTTDNAGETALHLAIQKGKWEAARHLLSLRNVNPDIPNARGETPLMIAAAGDDDHPINLLISKCQPTDQNCKALAMFLTNSSALISDENAIHVLGFGRSHQLVNIQDRNGMTPLSTLLRDCPAGQQWIYSRLTIYLRFGANSNLRDGLGRSAISYAAALSHSYPLLSLLYHEGPRADLSPDDCGRTPFTYAVLNRRPSLLEMLISHSLTFVDTPDRRGRTPLWHALSGAYRASPTKIPKTLGYLSMAEKLFATGKVNIFIQTLSDKTTPYDLLSRLILRLTEQNEAEALAVSNRLQSKFERYGRQAVVPSEYNIRGGSRIAELEA